ncbi:SCP2 sterol-binding domain-containing protein [Pigmentiphaga soli]|uniref:Ubiquinone biosynthesis accessory factor UbiJ n=1 Tax=Pigmentiphaga soli TaxID=1007095 RepID=A0ABP8HCG4_9BURK
MSALPSPYAAAVRALNALLAREPWARERLRPHAGKHARLLFGAARVDLCVTADGQVEWQPAANGASTEAPPAQESALGRGSGEPCPGALSAAPDVTLSVATDKLPSLLSGDAARRMSAVRIDGDAAFAHAIGDLARDLRWDAEEDLARLVGDIPAARLSAAASGAWRGLREGAWRLAENLAEYATEERGLVAGGQPLADWGAEDRRLRDDAERAAKRAAALHGRLAPQDGGGAGPEA